MAETNLMASLNTIENIKYSIKEAIIEKGQPVTNIDSFSTYANKILNISSGGGIDTSNTNLNIEQLVAKSEAYSIFTAMSIKSDITNLSSIFENNTTVEYMPSLNLINVVDMSNMFNGCSGLVSIANFDTANVTNMSGMFAECTNLQEIKSLNMSNVINAEGIFTNCVNLTKNTIANLVNILPDANNLTNQTVANLGLSNGIFTSKEINILMNKGYTDIQPVYNPNPNYTITINR